MVNVEQMFLPLAIADAPVPMLPGERGAWLAWVLTDALFRNKFLTLFSLLFGASFYLQWQRTRENPRQFRLLYLRRVVGLIAFGLAHALLFYMADVLILYGLVALGLLVAKGVSARRLVTAGSVLLLVTVTWYGILMAPSQHDLEQPAMHRTVVQEIARMRNEGTIRISASEHGPLKTFDFAEDIRNDKPLYGGAELQGDGQIRLAESEYALPMPAWLAILILDGNNPVEKAKVEYAVYSEGPVSGAIFNRAMFLLALLLLYTPAYLGWRTLALFLLGAGVVKMGLLRETERPAWKAAMGLGLGLGLPLTAFATALRIMTYGGMSEIARVGDVLQEIACLLLAGGLGGWVFLWCSGGLRNALQRGLMAVGKTALTNYLGQSVVMSLLATSYGFGLFGDLARLEILGLAILCFIGQLIVSSLWLRKFQLGPLEWLWRCWTYWRFLPLRRNPGR